MTVRLTQAFFARQSNAIVCLLAAAMLSACMSTKTQAPIETRNTAPTPGAAEAAAVPPVVPPALPRAGHHIVKRGETLYSISLEHGQDYREVARWNGIDNPNVIQVGQELRVIPPDTGSIVAPVATPSIEVKPVPGAAVQVAPLPGASGPVATGAGAVKTEPKGGRVAYSPQALADLQKAAVAAASTPSSLPVPSRPSTPVAGSAPVAAPMSSSPAAAVASAPVAEQRNGDESIDWLWPTGGKIVATFNDSTNKGIDLAGNVGDPVLATAAGKVIYVGSDLRGYGNLVIIKHNNLYLSAYAHNSEVLVKEGLQVARGQKIAAVGMSDADRPKLHFEIRRQGKPVDPLKYLPKR